MESEEWNCDLLAEGKSGAKRSREMWGESGAACCCRRCCRRGMGVAGVGGDDGVAGVVGGVGFTRRGGLQGTGLVVPADGGGMQ